ncbi:MAG: hydantoinase B/oxoprolinase family protein [Burkholderiales bacterium]
MAERPQQKHPLSLEALLSANRDQFDSLFERQMKVALPPLVPARRPRSKSDPAPASKAAPPERVEARAPEPAAPISTPRSNIKAELNRRFTFSWASEILDREIQNGRAIVRCKLKVGEDARVEAGSSRIGEDEDQEAAVQRAYDAALQKCADHFAAGTRTGNASDPQRASAPAALAPAEEARQAAARARPLDAVSIDQVQTALINTCQEMASVWARGAPSKGLRDDPRDPIGPALIITDAQGRMLAGGFGSYVAHMLEQRLEQRDLPFAPGDVLLQSDPYLSGGAVSRANDWLVLAPVFAGADLVGFTSMVAHVADVGGPTAGSTPVKARSVFGEGTRIPPIKIFAAGVLNEPALQVILNNSRTPQANRADLLALAAGCRAGGAQVMRICERVGRARYQQACAALLARSNQAMRLLIRERIPEEPQSFQDQIDDDGCGNGPFKLKLTVWREGDHAYFDWTGSSAEAPGPINLSLHVGLAKLFAGMLLARDADPSTHCNDGFHELIHITLPKGTIVNPAFPAAIGRCEQVLARHFEVLSSALGRHRPADLMAAGHGTAPSLRFAGTDANGVPFALIERFGGLSGLPPLGLPQLGPQSGGDNAGRSRLPIESVERDFPVVIESYASIADTGGAGLRPGANGVERIYRMIAAGEISIHDDRHASRPCGINGGKAGASSGKWRVRPDGTRETLPSKVERLVVELGERIVFRTAGGGGSGDPLQRDPGLVRQDVRRRLLTVDAAAAEYGVVLSGSTLDIDARATREMRDQFKRGRKPLELFDHGEPP